MKMIVNNSIDFICIRCLRGHSSSEGCQLCSHSRGYLVYTIDGQLIHKRCGLLLHNSIYHSQGSLLPSHHHRHFLSSPTSFSPSSSSSSLSSSLSSPGIVRSFTQFVLPEPKNRSLLKNYDSSSQQQQQTRYTCCMCEDQEGWFIKCSIRSCSTVCHLGCLDKRMMYYYQTEQGVGDNVCNDNVCNDDDQ